MSKKPNQSKRSMQEEDPSDLQRPLNPGSTGVPRQGGAAGQPRESSSGGGVMSQRPGDNPTQNPQRIVQQYIPPGGHLGQVPLTGSQGQGQGRPPADTGIEYINTSSTLPSQQTVWGQPSASQIFSDQRGQQQLNPKSVMNPNTNGGGSNAIPTQPFPKSAWGASGALPKKSIYKPMAGQEEMKPKRKIMIYCLYQLESIENTKMEMMLHKPEWKDKEFFPMGSSKVTFGEQTFYVFYRDHLIDEAYMLQFQPKIQTKHYGLSYEYYEKEKFARPFSEKEVQFIFDLNILQNNSNFSYKQPPGKSIVDAMTQLLYYMYYLMDISRTDLFEELLAQFRLVHPTVGGNLTERFSALVNSMVRVMMKRQDVGAELGKLLGVLGLIPPSVKNLRDVKLPNCQLIIDNTLDTVVPILKAAEQKIKFNEADSKSSIFKQLWSHQLNLSIKGYIFGMLVNLLDTQPARALPNMQLHSWQAQLVAIGEKTAIGGLAVATALLQRLQDNDLKMKTETLFWMNEVVKGLMLRVIQEDKSSQDIDDPFSYVQDRLSPGDIQDILLKLLEQPIDISSFIKLLKIIYTRGNDPQQEEEKVGEIMNNQYLEIQFNDQGERRVLDIVNKFLTKYLQEDLSNIINFLKTVNTFKGEPYEKFFIKSQARNFIAKRLGDTYTFRYDYPAKVNHLRQIFITHYSDLYVEKDLFGPCIIQKNVQNQQYNYHQQQQEDTMNLLQNLDNLSDCYKKLLKDWGDWDLNLLLVKKYFHNKISTRQMITNLVTDFDEYINEFFKECPANQDDPKYRAQREFITRISEEAVNAIHLRTTQVRDKILIDYEPLSRLYGCKNKDYVDFYIFKAKTECIKNIMTNKDPPYIPLERLIPTHLQFRAKHVDEKIILGLIDYAFSFYKDRPDLNKVKGELLQQASTRSVWFLFLKNFELYNGKEPVKHIAKMVTEIASSLLKEQLNIGELLDINGQSQLQRRAFLEYMQQAQRIIDLTAAQVDGQQREEVKFERVIRSQLESVSEFLNKKERVQNFLYDTMKLKKDSPLVNVFETHFDGYMKKTMQQIKDFPANLTQIQGLAERLATLKDSKVFQNYLETQHNQNRYIDENGIVNPEIMLANITAAFTKLKEHLIAFLISPDDAAYPVKNLSLMLGEKVRINRIQAKAEAKALMETFDRENRADRLAIPNQHERFTMLEEILYSFSELPRLTSVCQGVINFATMQYTKRVGDSQVQEPIFNLDIKGVLTTAQYFVEVCITNFKTASLKDFYQSFKSTERKIYSLIEGSVRGFEQTRINRAELRQMQERGVAEAVELFDNPNIAAVVKILRSFNQGSIELFQFLKIISGQELDQLKEYVNDYDEEGVSTQTILNCVSLWDYMTDINKMPYKEGRPSGPTTFPELIDFIVQNLDNPKYRELHDKIDKCNHQIVAIKELKSTLESREEAKKKQILKIMKQSHIYFRPPGSQKENHGQDAGAQVIETPSHSIANNIISQRWNIELKYIRAGEEGKAQDDKKFDIEDISELRDRALLIQNTLIHEHNKKKQQTEEEKKKIEEEQNQMSDFILFAKTIQSILSNLDSLYVAGYPRDQNLFQTDKFECTFRNFDELVTFEKHLATELVDWVQTMTKAYNSSYFMTFLTGENIWVLESYLQDKVQQPQDVKRAQNLLALMGKKRTGQPMDDSIFFDLIDDNPKMRLQSLAMTLNNLDDLEEGDISFSGNVSTTDRTTIADLNPGEDRQGHRITVREGEILFIESYRYFDAFVSIYINSGRHFPKPDQIFFCHEKTQWQEIQSFMFRCLKCPKKQLHTMIYPEQLSLEHQEKLTALIQKFMKEEMPHDPFYLCIIAKEGRSLFSDYLKQQTYRRVVRDQLFLSPNKVSQMVQIVDKTSVFVTSKIAGLGKTHYIQKKARRSGKEVVMFPIAGAIELDEIAERLKDIQIPEEGVVLALQIRFVDNIDLLNEFLVHLALFRVFSQGANIFILPASCELYIELGNTFDNLFEQRIFYRKYVEPREYKLEAFNIGEFEVNTDLFNNAQILLDDTQFICNHLNHYRRSLQTPALASQDIVFDVLTQQECINLLGEYFLEGQLEANQEPNYIQLRVFLKIIGRLLRNLENSIYSPILIQMQAQEYTDNNLQGFSQDYLKIRITLFKAILDTVKQFTVKSINRKMRSAQGEARAHLALGINNNAEANLEDEFEMTLSWESSNHFTEIVIEDGSLIFVYKDPIQVPKDIQMFIFINKCIRENKQGPEISQLISSNQIQIPDLSKMTDLEFQGLLQMFRTHHNILQVANDEYVVTADNFLKMCIIYLRVQSRVPVVIMGETGCGKTSLIKFFSQNILNDKLIIFNIHAGITANMILDKVNECILIAYKMDENKKLWVFFDEFNTTENLGLICEILSERTILGQPIPDNICLLAACNPFKLRSKKVEFGENVGIKRAKAQNRMAQNLLMYTVHPIPENIIENVWDFGALQDKDAQKYINQMLTKAGIKNVPMITSMLLACHSYFKKNEDNSSVSLRDVARFIILSQWFKKSIEDKQRLERDREQGRWQRSPKYLGNKEKYMLKVEDYYNIGDIDLRASVLALTHCYYLRISNMRSRYQFLEAVCTAQNEQPTLTAQRVLDIINCEQNDYIIRMDLQDGTAVNQALKENIFAIIPCIINRIPIFICGKPGCSKSMAISLVFQNLRGQKSVDPYFKTLKELTMVSFQGSESCTSDGILKAYEKAKKYLELQRNDIANNLLPVFVFDEIGLAEISKYNPLKVLHSLLEVENREIAFVGISNWRLDASKMNRALYLARPDPDEEDLKFTAFCIYQQICMVDKHKHLIECLASSYFDLKDYFKKQKPEFQDFYGLRDFYHMIKQISRAISKGQHIDRDQPQRDLLYHVNLAIARNFGGRFGAAEILGKYFSYKFDVLDRFPVAQRLTPNVRELIHMNMSDRDSRYLMLIGRPDVLRFILETYFKEEILESRTIVGSKLANDQSKEEYGFRALSDIILYVEKGISIILYGMEDIYSSLYDLFNQNFAVYGEKRYCRIALGAQLNPQCFVHERFHSVIFMNEDDDSLQAADAPFLNRFEKHYVRLDDILNDHQKYVVNELIGWIDSLLNNRMREKQILLHETNIFPNFSEDMLGILVMQEEWPEGIEDEKELYKIVIQNCKKRLLKIATQDILILVQLADIAEEESRWITQNYQEVHLKPFLTQLQRYVKKGNYQQENITQKVLALTYTLGFDLSISENSNGKINFRSISNFKSEQEIIKQLHQFYDSETEIVFILDANYITDKQHVSFVKFIVDKVERDAYDGKIWKGCKTVLFMLHMQRNFNEKNQSQVPVFDDSWKQVVFYDTSLEPFTLSEDIVMKNTRQLLMDQSVVKFDQSLKNMTDKCLLKLTFDGELSQEDQDSINDNMFFIIENIAADPQLVECFKQKIFASIMSQQRIIDWKDEISCNIDVIKDSANVWQAIKMVIEARYEQYLTVLLFQIEKWTAFRSYFTEFSELVDGQKQDIGESIQLIKKIWIQSFNKLKTTQIELQNLPQSNYASFIANLKFPFSRSEAEILKEIYKLQVAFETGSEETDQTPIEHFSQQFIAKTKFGDLIDEIINDKYVQEVYIQDIVKIFLIENILKPQYLTIVMIIMKKIMNNPNNSFYEKLYIFMKHQKLFFSLCTILDLFQQLKGDQFSLQDLEKEFQEQLDDMSEGRTWEDMIRKILDVYIIKNSQPDQYALHNLKSINNMSTIYEKFYSNLFNFKSTVKIKNLSVIRFWTDFTALVAEQGGIQQNFLFKCSEIAFKIDGDDDDENESDEDNLQPQEDETNFMADIGFINMVLVFYETGGKKLVVPVVKRAPAGLAAEGGQEQEEEKIPGGNEDAKEEEAKGDVEDLVALEDPQEEKVDAENQEEEKKEEDDDDNQIVEHDLINLDDRTVKFLSSFFTIILEMNFKRLSIVAQRFQMPQYKSLFRYSSSIFQEIMRHTKLLPTVEELRITVQNDEVAVDVANDILPEIELPDSYELEVLEKVLGEVGLDSNFAIAINDVIMRQVSDNTEDRVYSFNLLAKEFLIHERLLVKLQVPEAERVRVVEYPNLKQLVAHSVLKTIIEVYTDLIFFNNLERERQEHPEWDILPFEETDELKEARLGIEDELAKREWGPVRTLQMHCLKQLKQKMKVGNAQFKDALGLKFAPHAKWIAESEALHVDQETAMPLDSYPHIQEVSEAQEELIRDLKNFMKYRLPEQKEPIKNRMRQMNTVQDFLKTGLAFLKACYLQYAEAKQQANFADLERFYQEELEEIAEIKSGVQYARLLKHFISNFPLGNFLRMESNLPQADMHQRMLSCQILLHTFVHTRTPNPISSLFYTYEGDGKFTLDVTQFKGCFMPGVELEPKYKYLFDFYTHFEDKKNKQTAYCDGYGGASYICGDDCDFFFVVGECGNLVGAGTCPWCKREVGAYQGKYGALQPRAGFRRFKEQDAKEFLRQLIVKYEQRLKPGYSVVEQANLAEFQMSFYKTRPLSWRLIRQFVHIPLYFLLTLGGCTQDAFNQVISVQNLQAQHNKTPKDFLLSHIVNDFNVFEKLLSIGGQDHIAPWLYSVINRYSTVLKAGAGMDLKTNQNARAFEEAFDTQVLGNLAEKIGDVAIEYKNSLQVKGGKVMSDFDAAFQEIVAVKGIYPGLQFYRLVRTQSFEDMITSFKNVKANEDAFPILKVCINQYETLLKLRHFYPIIEFTNHLIGKYNHMLKREDARQQRVREHFQQNDEGRQLKSLFDSFLKAWAGMGLDSIQFECHELPKLHYDENSELIHFLADNKEKGNGMAMLAAMQELGKLQNNILGDVLHEYAKQKQLESKYVLDTHQYPIQRIKPHHIVNFPIDNPQKIKSFTMNSLAYGHGQEVVYDFGRLEMNILKDFEQRKFVSTDKDSFEYIQYQMEIFTSSGSKKNFILEIRGRIKQSAFDRETSIKIDQYFEVIESRGQEDKIQTLRDLHGGLEKILCFLQNTREDRESTIEHFVNNKMKGNKHRVYSENTTFSQVKLMNILALYEKLEEKYFPHVTKSVRPDYTSMRNEREIRGTLEGILRYSEVAPNGAAGNEGQLIPTRKQIQNALLRFIIRCLAGEFNKQDLLGVWFVYKHDVWDEELVEAQDFKLDNLLGHMSNTTITLEDTYCTYKVMHELNLEKEQRALAPQIGQQEPARVDKRRDNVQMPVGPPVRQAQRPQNAAKKRLAAAKKQDQDDDM